jgi:hypothetical protein
MGFRRRKFRVRSGDGIRLEIHLKHLELERSQHGIWYASYRSGILEAKIGYRLNIRLYSIHGDQRSSVTHST